LCIRPAIGEPLLEVIPHAFVGVQFRGIRPEGAPTVGIRRKPDSSTKTTWAASRWGFFTAGQIETLR
jgi:hypothetical protein